MLAALLFYRSFRRRRGVAASTDQRRAGVTGVRRPVVLRRIALTSIPAIVVAAYWRTIALAHLNASAHLGGQGFVHDVAGFVHLALWALALAWLAAALLFVTFSDRDLGRFAGTALAPGLVPVASGSIFSWLLALLVALVLLVRQVNRDELVPADPNEISPYHQSLLDRGLNEADAARLAQAAAERAAQHLAGGDDADEDDHDDSAEIDAILARQAQEHDQQASVEALDEHEAEQRELDRELFDQLP